MFDRKKWGLPKQRARPRHLEDTLQEHCVFAFRLQWQDILIFAIPNGGKRSKFEAARMKKQGVTAGIPDLFLSAKRGEYGGLYIELKVGKNGLSESQKQIKAHLEAEGYKYEVHRNVDTFMEGARGYLNL